VSRSTAWDRRTHEVPSSTSSARCRLERWRSEPPFANGSSFSQRLAADGINEDDLYRLLGETAAALQRRFTVRPNWLATLADAFSRLALPGAFRSTESISSDDLGGFLVLITLDLLQPM
jgi:hypothetical protein